MLDLTAHALLTHNPHIVGLIQSDRFDSLEVIVVLVVFPSGIDCRWDIHKAVRKHYRFSD